MAWIASQFARQIARMEGAQRLKTAHASLAGEGHRVPCAKQTSWRVVHTHTAIPAHLVQTILALAIRGTAVTPFTAVSPFVPQRACMAHALRQTRVHVRHSGAAQCVTNVIQASVLAQRILRARGPYLDQVLCASATLDFLQIPRDCAALYVLVDASTVNVSLQRCATATLVSAIGP
mmetsp:Transcript_24477/g.73285  ORF Transcript_24477/g.73285 Transcript_24477/m.73285 type:complete len:177 (+) Transcript_24477:5845-6375(+)